MKACKMYAALQVNVKRDEIHTIGLCVLTQKL